jgi:transposase
MALWHNARSSLRKIRVQLIGELDAMIHALPEELRDQLPDRTTARAKITAMAKLDTSAVTDPVHRLALDLIGHRLTMLQDVFAQDKAAEAELAKLVTQTRSTLPTISGIAARGRRNSARSRRCPPLHRGRLRPLHRNCANTCQLR